jgi:hypothetical protein
MVEVRYLGHSAVWLSDGQTRIIIDPFLTGNPMAAASLAEVQADLILVTHAHGDHFGDSVALSKKGGVVVSTFEIATYAEKHGAKSVPMNIGGTYRFPGGFIKWFPRLALPPASPTAPTGACPWGWWWSLRASASTTPATPPSSRIWPSSASLTWTSPLPPHRRPLHHGARGRPEGLGPPQAQKGGPHPLQHLPPIKQDGEAFARRAREKGVEGHALKPGGVLVLD